MNFREQLVALDLLVPSAPNMSNFTATKTMLAFATGEVSRHPLVAVVWGIHVLLLRRFPIDPCP